MTPSAPLPQLIIMSDTRQMAYYKPSVHALLYAIEMKVTCIERDLHELRIPACGLIAIDAWNLIQQIQEARK